MTKDKITLEQVEQFMAMLTGERLPDCWEPDETQPKLTARQAFGVCEELYDSEHGGFTVDPSDAPDDWHDEIGVTREMIAESGGGMVCSMECEVAFWREKFPEWVSK